MTKEVVKKYQKDKGLVGKKTMVKLLDSTHIGKIGIHRIYPISSNMPKTSIVFPDSKIK